MKSKDKILSLCIILVPFIFSCVKQYSPPVVQTGASYLVVDGFINASPNSISTFTLRYSGPINDSFYLENSEPGAQFSIQSKSGEIYQLVDSSNTGVYSSPPLSLNINGQYKINIVTTGGKTYSSSFVPVKVSQPIDSITWRQDGNLTIMVNTHDPTNSSIYYKWDFVETWQHNSDASADYFVVNGIMVLSNDPQYAYLESDSCWTTMNSNTLITGTSFDLSNDVISEQPITTIQQNDPRVSVLYSILVRQIPITVDAFNYWSLIKKNSQELGTLFDSQPSQLSSNIQCTSNPNEPVIGYLTAAAPQQLRQFISNSQVSNWLSTLSYTQLNEACPVDTIPYGWPDPWVYPGGTQYPLNSFQPWYGGKGFVAVTPIQCTNCMVQGGNNIRPSFWP